MAMPNWPVNDLQGSISFADGSGVPVTLSDVDYTRGDIAITGLGSSDDLNESIVVKARGRNIGVVAGDRVDPQITFSAFFMGESLSTPGSIQAFLRRQAPYTANVSTLGAGRRYAVNCTITIEQSDFTAGASDWSTTFHDCILTDISINEDRGGTYVSFTLLIFGEITGSIELDTFGA